MTDMENKGLSFGTFFWRISSSHMVSYFIMGVIASSLLNYGEAFANPPLSYIMRPIDSPWVAAGPVLQIFRGLIFSLALWFFRDGFLNGKYGWARLWLLLTGLSVLSTTGPASGSVEGYIYTNIPPLSQARGYLEVLPQTLLFSLFVFYWFKNPKRIYNILSIILVCLIVLLCTMGLLVSLKMI